MPIRPQPKGITSRREARLVVVAQLFIQRKTLDEIAAATGVSVSRACRDLKIVRERWSAKRDEKLTTHRAEELAVINEIHRQAFRSWLASLAPERTCEVTTEEPQPAAEGQPATVPKKRRKETTRFTNGDAKYLAVLQWCSESRRKLLGLDGVAEEEGGQGGGTKQAMLPAADWQEISKMLTPEEIKVMLTVHAKVAKFVPVPALSIVPAE